MKTQTTFQNSSLVSVVNGSIVVKDSTGEEHTIVNASVVSVNNGTIVIESEGVPKRGELVKVLGSNIDCYVIFKSISKYSLYTFGGKELSGAYYKLTDDLWAHNNDLEFHPVTPEEQKEFDDFCISQGKIWNKETLQWEKYKWHPKDWERYYIVYGNGEIDHLHYVKSEFQDRYIDLGNCFQTKEQAEKIAEQVKEFFKSL